MPVSKEGHKRVHRYRSRYAFVTENSDRDPMLSRSLVERYGDAAGCDSLGRYGQSAGKKELLGSNEQRQEHALGAQLRGAFRESRQQWKWVSTSTQVQVHICTLLRLTTSEVISCSNLSTTPPRKFSASTAALPRSKSSSFKKKAPGSPQVEALNGHHPAGMGHFALKTIARARQVR